MPTNVTINDHPAKTLPESTDEIEIQEIGGGDSKKINFEALGQLILPTGMMMFYAENANVPDGWLRCEGQEISRVQYAKLFSAIGVQYGDGDGNSTFKLPRRRVRISKNPLSYIRLLIKY
jgi:hypothetical protein